MLCRQTNIIWVIFVAANGAISYVEDLSVKERPLRGNYDMLIGKHEWVPTDKKTKASSSNLRKRQKYGTTTSEVLRSDSSEKPLDHTPGL